MPFMPLLEWVKNNSNIKSGQGYGSQLIVKLIKGITALDLNKDKFNRFEKETAELKRELFEEGSKLADKIPSNVVLNPSYMMRKERNIIDKILRYYIEKWSIHILVFGIDNAVLDKIKAEINNLSNDDLYAFTVNIHESEVHRYEYLYILPFGINFFIYPITTEQVEAVLKEVIREQRGMI